MAQCDLNWERRRKLTIVGDATVGKTCLVISYVMQAFPLHWIPSTYHGWVEDFDYGGERYNVAFWDIVADCSEEYSRLRVLSYPNTDVFLLCFSLVDFSSYENIRTRWYPETVEGCSDATYLLVGTKLDLREGGGSTELIGYSQGEAMAKEIGAVKYLECSALTREGLKNVFEEALTSAAQMPARRQARSGCIVA